jgi:hypothetical protein
MHRVPRFRVRFLFLFIVAALFMGVHEAHARRGFVLITHGDAVSEMGPARLPAEAAAAAPELNGAKIGFHYDYFGFFWLDLWNWNGEYVIYNSDRQATHLTKAQAAVLLGVPESEIGTPLNYKFPFGLDILVGIGLLKMIPRWTRRNSFSSTGFSTPARVDKNRPRWTPPPRRKNADAPPLNLVFPSAGSGTAPPAARLPCRRRSPEMR